MISTTTISLSELCERLSNEFDEVSLIELLEITSEDLVKAFPDLIEERMDYLIQELEELPSVGEDIYEV